ncbi:MAG: IS66 family transposase [Deltaproteobacteria bacterium]
MRTRTRKPAIIDVDMAAVDALLVRARAALSSEDHECLSGLVQTLIQISKLVRERGTTIARLRRLFGLASSEKTADVLAKLSRVEGEQGSGSEQPGTSSDSSGDAAAGAPPAETDRDGTTDDKTTEPKSTRKGHGRIAASEYPNARRITVEHQSLHTGNACPGCACGRLFQLRDPACIVRIVGQAPLAATAWECERLRCSGCGKVFTARAPDDAQGPKYDDSAVSMMALLRYGTGMPLNRLDQLQRHLETPVPASTQWEVVRDRAQALTPVYDELHRQAAQGRVLHNDDTSSRILAFMGKRRAELCIQGLLPDPERTGLFTTAIVAVTDVGPIALFFTGRKHAGENLATLLDERDPALATPVQMCDGLDRNIPTDHDVILSNCLAHGRRHIVDEVENFPDQCQHVLEELGKTFKNESTCRERGLRGLERLEFHQRESSHVMAELETWLNAELDEKRVEPNSGLGKAFNYLLKRWQALTAFLRVPDAPLDNNLCERVLKMAIRHRNNSLFYRSQRGAEIGDLYMTLIYTAELHGENPFEYLTALLRHDAEVQGTPAAWLPWTFRATLAALAVGAQRAA